MVGELSKASYLWDKIVQVTLKRSGEYEILSSVNLGRRKYELRMWFWSANFGNRELGMVQMTLEICLSETHASGNRDAQTKDLSSQAMLIPDVKATMEKGWEEVIKKAHTKTKGKESPLCCIDRHPPHLKVQEHTRDWSQEQSISSLDKSTSTSRWKFARAMSSVEIMKFKWVQSLTQWLTVLTNEMLREWIRNHPPVQVPSLSILEYCTCILTSRGVWITVHHYAKRKRTSIICVSNLPNRPWNITSKVRKIRTMLKRRSNLPACIGKPLPSRCG